MGIRVSRRRTGERGSHLLCGLCGRSQAISKFAQMTRIRTKEPLRRPGRHLYLPTSVSRKRKGAASFVDCRALADPHPARRYRSPRPCPPGTLRGQRLTDKSTCIRSSPRLAYNSFPNSDTMASCDYSQQTEASLQPARIGCLGRNSGLVCRPAYGRWL